MRYAPIAGVEPTGVNFKTFKARWGSCTAKGELEFNWLIMLAPNRMVDYVVIHQLCHLIHHDHSSERWRAVMRVMPDYQLCREWLRENSGAGGSVGIPTRERGNETRLKSLYGIS